MLDFERRRALDPQDQRGRFRLLVASGPRPIDLERFAVGGDLSADNVVPARDDLGRGKTLRLEDVAQGRAQQLRKRPGKTARGLAHQDGPCAIVGAMTVAVRSSSRKKTPLPEAAGLLAWYDRHARVLPWRAKPGHRTDAYRVWLSEIMLQQTTVKAVAPYYTRFVAKWPTVKALAAADLEDVLRAWAGLGYYARARNLHGCAKAVVERHNAKFPKEIDALRALPGIGTYTAAAIAAIAFDQPAVPVDGNIERVVARLFAVEEELPGAKPAIRRLAESLMPASRSGDFAQAMMDLGAAICSPRRPICALCPWNGACVASARGDPETFPRKAPKREGRLRRGAAFVALRD